MPCCRGKVPRVGISLLLPLLFLSGCGETATGPVRELAPLVGVWEAQSLVVPDPEGPGSIDLIQDGASYVLSILATGQYSAVFDLLVVRGFEAGKATVHGNEILLVSTTPAEATTSGTWSLDAGTLTVDVIRELDIDGDGEPEVVPFGLEFTLRTS